MEYVSNVAPSSNLVCSSGSQIGISSGAALVDTFRCGSSGMSSGSALIVAFSCSSIGISSGASVPDILVQDVVEKLEEYFNVDVDHVTYGEENVYFKLPKELRK